MRSSILCCVISFTVCFTGIRCHGTTPHLIDILRGRCFEYTHVLDKGTSRSYNCDEILRNFFDAFIYKDPCTLIATSYHYFMTAATPTIPVNKALFWSGTYVIAHEYAGSGKRFITLEDTLIGHLANGLTWCGTKEGQGINYQSCPLFSSCPAEAAKSFWGAASRTFASQVSGVVTLMLNGSNPNSPAYRTDREMCGTKSLLTLAKAIKDKGLQYECVDDPQQIVYLLCVDDPDSRECRHITHNHIPASVNRNGHANNLYGQVGNTCG